MFQHLVDFYNYNYFIVTAAVYWSLNPRLNSCEHHPRFLTYQHWAGVSPYTLLFSFAGTCVLDKQLQSKLLLWPYRNDTARHLP